MSKDSVVPLWDPAAMSEAVLASHATPAPPPDGPRRARARVRDFTAERHVREFVGLFEESAWRRRIALVVAGVSEAVGDVHRHQVRGGSWSAAGTSTSSASRSEARRRWARFPQLAANDAKWVRVHAGWPHLARSGRSALRGPFAILGRCFAGGAAAHLALPPARRTGGSELGAHRGRLSRPQPHPASGRTSSTSSSGCSQPTGCTPGVARLPHPRRQLPRVRPELRRPRAAGALRRGLGGRRGPAFSGRGPLAARAPPRLPSGPLPHPHSPRPSTRRFPEQGGPRCRGRAGRCASSASAASNGKKATRTL